MITLTEAEYRDHENNSDGLCLSCEEIIDGGVEPDADGYECPFCDEYNVVGIPNALTLGQIDILEEP